MENTMFNPNNQLFNFKNVDTSEWSNPFAEFATGNRSLFTPLSMPFKNAIQNMPQIDFNQGQGFPSQRPQLFQPTPQAPNINPFTGLPTKYSDIGSQLFVALHGNNPIKQAPQAPQQAPSISPAMQNILDRNRQAGIVFPSWFGQGA